MKSSSAELLASLPEAERASILASLTDEQVEELCWDWQFWAREAQKLPPGILPDGLPWLTWLIMTGRGWGKTRTGSETIRQWACGSTPLTAGPYRRFALIAETAADARDVMVEGESGILACHPKAFRPLYEPSKRRVTWPNGAVASLFNATEPDQLRGPQFDAAWCDELAKWQYARETWDMLQFGLRLGDCPRQIVTTTPRPISVLKEIMAAPTTVMVRGSTRENSGNLAPSFLRQIQVRYEGTRLGRQELEAEVLDDNPSALWNRAMIEAATIPKDAVPRLARSVVAIDPSGTKGNDEGDDVGIVGAARGEDGILYILHDRTCQESPAGWGAASVKLYQEMEADRIVGERNFGGAMVEHVVRSVDKNVSYKEVTASRGKWVRAEPVAALYEQGKVRHVGSFPQLEDELCAFGPDGLSDGKSPNRLDALVWAATELMLGDTAEIIKPGWWKPWKAQSSPSYSQLIAVLHTGFSDDTDNRRSAVTVWGIFRQNDVPRAMLFYAWDGRAALHDLAKGVAVLCTTGPIAKEEMAKVTANMGVQSLPRCPVTRLVIEVSDAGKAAYGELATQLGAYGIPVEAVDATRWGDATARLYGIQHLFADGLIYAPVTKPFAKKLIEGIAEYPASARSGLVNSASCALQYLRDTGLLLRQEEQARNVVEEQMFRGREKPLYG